MTKIRSGVYQTKLLADSSCPIPINNMYTRKAKCRLCDSKAILSRLFRHRMVPNHPNWSFGAELRRPIELNLPATAHLKAFTTEVNLLDLAEEEAMFIISICCVMSIARIINKYREHYRTHRSSQILPKVRSILLLRYLMLWFLQVSNLDLKGSKKSYIDATPQSAILWKISEAQDYYYCTCKDLRCVLPG